MKARAREILLASLVAFLGLVVLLARTDRLTCSHPDFMKPWDHHKYIEMAQHNPFTFHIAPFAWRFLNPFLAKSLPFDISLNFAILSFAALWSTAVVTYVILREVGFSPHLAFVGLLFFLSLGWATRANLYDFWLTDPLAFLFIAAVLWCICAEKDLLFAVLLAIGVTAKESVVFVAPLYYTFNARKLSSAGFLLRSLGLIAPAVLVLILQRVAIAPKNGDADYLMTIAENLRDPYPYSAGWLLEHIGRPRLQQLSPGRLVCYSVGTFGVCLSFLPLFALRRNLTLLWEFAPFIILTYASLLFASNTNRLAVAAFPAVIIMALHGAQSIAASTGTDERVFLLLPLLLLALLLLKQEWLVVDSLLESFIMLVFLAFVSQSKQLLL